MAAQQYELQPVTTSSTTAQGGDRTLTTATMAAVYLNVTSAAAGSGGFWLQARSQAGVYFDIEADQVLVLAASSGQQTSVVNKRNINGDTLVTAAGKYKATFKHMPYKIVRLAWIIAGGSLTFDAYMDVK